MSAKLDPEEKARRAKARAAFTQLKKDVKAFKRAIARFHSAYEPQYFGIEEWMESLEDDMYELREDMNDAFRR